MTASSELHTDGKPTEKVIQRRWTILVIIVLLLVALAIAVGMIVYLSGISQSTEQDPVITPTSKPVTIWVTISMEDDFITNTTGQWNASVSQGATLLTALQTLERHNQTFSFESKPTNLGPMITTINNITADASSMIWTIIKDPDQPASTGGVESIIPADGDHFIFRLGKESHNWIFG